jgi:hypothetical protein
MVNRPLVTISSVIAVMMASARCPAVAYGISVVSTITSVRNCFDILSILRYGGARHSGAHQRCQLARRSRRRVRP